MQFLDAIGLAYFWEKIKASFVNTKGESVINTDDDNSGLSVQNIGSATTTLTPSGFVSYNSIGDETDMVARLQYGDLLLSKIHLKTELLRRSLSPMALPRLLMQKTAFVDLMPTEEFRSHNLATSIHLCSSW